MQEESVSGHGLQHGAERFIRAARDAGRKLAVLIAAAAELMQILHVGPSVGSFQGGPTVVLRLMARTTAGNVDARPERANGHSPSKRFGAGRKWDLRFRSNAGCNRGCVPKWSLRCQAAEISCALV